MHTLELKLSILIISFNTRDILQQCLFSIYASNIRYSYEIIVVDNNSHDDSKQMIKQNFPLVTLIENKDNLLFAKANNQAAAIAKGEYLLLLNSDTIIVEGNIEKLVEFLDSSDNRIACVGPVVLNKDNTIQSSGFALPSIYERFTMIFKLNRVLPKVIARLILPVGTPGIYTGNYKVGWVSGCCILIKKNIYLSLGGLNEMLEFYGEEPELGWKLKKHGYETWLVDNSTIIHLGGGSSKNDSAYFLNDLEGRLYRYAQLQKYTVGYKKAIKMSKVVILGSYLKRFFIFKYDVKQYFDKAIKYEKKMVAYLRYSLKNEDKD